MKTAMDEIENRKTIEKINETKFFQKKKHNERKERKKMLSRVRLFVAPWTVAHQTPPSMGFSRQQYWSGLPFPSPGYLPDLVIGPRTPTMQADALLSEPPGKPIDKDLKITKKKKDLNQ